MFPIILFVPCCPRMLMFYFIIGAGPLHLLLCVFVSHRLFYSSNYKIQHSYLQFVFFLRIHYLNWSAGYGFWSKHVNADRANRIVNKMLPSYVVLHDRVSLIKRTLTEIFLLYLPLWRVNTNTKSSQLGDQQFNILTTELYNIILGQRAQALCQNDSQ